MRTQGAGAAGARAPLVTLAALLLALGCGEPSAPSDAGLADAARADAAVDAGFEGLRIPEPEALPIGELDAIRFGPGLQIDVASVFSLEETGAVTLAFETFTGDFAYAELWAVRSRDGRGFPIPRPLDFTEHALEASPSFVGTTLYFVGADDLASAPVIYRGAIGLPEPLPAVPGVASLLSWPRLYAWGDRVALAFRDGASRPMLATGDDPESLGAPVLVGPETGGAMAALGVFGDGTLAYAYQHPEGAEPMVSFVRRSSDGVSFTEPVRVTDASSNVHDAALVPRSDGGLDLYYIYPGASGFVLHRRALTPDGRMGAEEQVTADGAGEPSKPSGVRLPSGRVLVAWADIAERHPTTGEPTRQDLVLASLPAEAAPP